MTAPDLREALDALMPYVRHRGNCAVIGNFTFAYVPDCTCDRNKAVAAAFDALDALPKWPPVTDEAVEELADELAVYMGSLRAKEAATAILTALSEAAR